MSISKNLALLTDLYQLTMGEGYFQNNTHNEIAVFHLFYRKAPFGGQSCIAAGLETAVEVLKNFHFDQSDIEYLKTLNGNKNQSLFSKAYLSFLEELKFTCHIDAVVEGSIVFPRTPIMRIEGPILQCQLIETILLNIINFQTLIATKASRIRLACKDDSLLEFGLRRAQGTDGGLTASRACYIGGVNATSNVLAGKEYNIPVKGTHAHSWIMSFDDELDAFMKYAKVMPHNCILLVDTYDTLKGVKNAIIVADYLLSIGHQLIGIRLDSGNLATLSQECRQLLDQSGHKNVKIVASNDLDEYEITRLKALGSKIDIWGVGTKLVTAYDQPALGGVYKLAAIKSKSEDQFKYKIKLSNDPIKNSFPGVLQVRRFYKDNKPLYDLIYNIDQIKAPLEEDDKTISSGDQLIPIFRSGRLIYKLPSLTDIRELSLFNLNVFEQTENFKVKIHHGIQKTISEFKF